MYQNTFDTYLIHVPTLLISCPVPVACQQPSVQTVLTKSSFVTIFLLIRDVHKPLCMFHQNFFAAVLFYYTAVGTCSHRLLFIFLMPQRL